MLAFTNRAFDNRFDNQKRFTRAYSPLSDTLNICDVALSSDRNPKWSLSNAVENASDQQILTRLRDVFGSDKPVLLYVHGNNNTPKDCFERSMLLEEQYNISVIPFSWTSEGYGPDGSDLSGIVVDRTNDVPDESLADVNSSNIGEGWIQRKIRRYSQAKVNAQHSHIALARFLRLAASSRLATMKQPFSAAFHSLGCHFLHYAIEQPGTSAALAAAHNISLIAGCTGAEKHTAWVGKIVPERRVYIMYTNADSVLMAARLVDGDVKLGTNPGANCLSAPHYRYIDFEGASKMKLGAHRYFVADPGKKLSKRALRLFSRIFRSVDDLSRDEQPRRVYPLSCSPDGATCYMGTRSPIQGGG
ncbi:MAG: alpha/beta hydrolase [Rhodocyclaceae bacterium]|uniref:hypothetical protein n=1 Tax=Methyloceanibacter sp. TaxID=1965321 RepID=UPI001D8C5CD9|nr:hypothetical protein [Methyloceanibacter sp.]MCB1442149.1 alpha/beta hydrolase [Methyloceanibacter sp.]MCB1930780.1 alpha/beta hydrolase [Rhodocyclaceae bacterium]